MKKAISNIISAIPALVLIALFAISSLTKEMPAAQAMDTSGMDEPVVTAEPALCDINTPISVETIPEVDPLEEFLAGVDDEHSKELYMRLFEMYDYEQFVGRSEIPQYFQSVYHKTAFASGTIKSSGCGISCLAMITSYLYGQTITPDMYTLDYHGDNPASVLERLVSEDYLNIRMDKYYGNDARTQFHIAMENGNPVIMLHREGSIFTEGGHFIVVTGMTEDGRYIVNDPNMYNLLRTTYADEYMHGFTWDQLKRGLVGTYVFDTRAEFDGNPALIPNRK